MNIDIAFVHGWAMNSAVWQWCLQRLQDNVNVRCIDLPGYGAFSEVRAGGLEEYVDHIARQLDGPALMVGWSLGGLVTLELAQRYPDKVAALCQVATNPKFVQDDDWPPGIEPGVLQQFAASLQKDRDRTIKRFLALQVRATDSSTKTVRELHRAIDQRGLPTVETLAAGLEILSATDLRAVAETLSCPVSWVLGEKDMLVPVDLAAELRRMPSRPDITILAGAGHAPFISHPDAFVKALLHCEAQL